MSIDLLITKIKEKNNPTVAGLDPLIDYVPKFIREKNFSQYGKTLKGIVESIYEFNTGLIDQLYDIVPAVKPQSAYYEMYGYLGVEVLDRTIKYAKQKGLYVIADVKRNDIGSTAQAYSSAYLGGVEFENTHYDTFLADSATVNGYLGTDGIEPFIKSCNDFEKSIFVLVKTSNKSSGELQDLKIGEKTVYEVMADMVKKWGETSMGKLGYSNVGAVVGATYSEQQKILRQAMPNTYFLVPGYGAQGAGAKDIVNAFNKDGLGAIVNSSRAIMCAYKKAGDDKDFAQAARQEAIRMRDEILSVL